MINYDVIPVIWKMDHIGKYDYFWDMTHNALFFYDGTKAHNIELKCTNDRKIYMEHVLYNGVYGNGQKLYLSPNRANYGLIFNIDNGTERYIEYPDEIKEFIRVKNINILFTKIIFDKKYAYYIGAEIPCLLVLDLNTEVFVKTIVFECNSFSFFKDGLILDGRIYLAEAENNRVFIIDDSFSYTVKTFIELKKGFSSLCSYGSMVFLIPRYDEPMILWDVETGYQSVILDYPEAFSFAQNGNREIAFSKLVEDRIYFFPAFSSDVIYYDIRTKCLYVDQIISDAIKSEKSDEMEETTKCIFVERIDDELLIQNGYSLRLIVYNYKKNNIRKIDLMFDEEENAVYKRLKMRTIINKNEIISEGKSFLLEDFIRVVVG